MKKLKILTYTTLFPNNVDPNFAVFIYERMRNVAENADLKVVAPVPYSPKIKFIKKWYAKAVIDRHEHAGDIEITHPRFMLTPKIGMNTYGLSMYLSTKRHVSNLYKRYPFDIIDGHYIYPDGLAAVMLGKHLNIPVVLSARGTDINLYTGFKTIRRQIRYTLQRADKIVAVCTALKESMMDLGIESEKIVVIPNGIDNKKFFRKNREICREELNLPMQKNIILSVGQLIHRKGFHVIIDAMNLLLKKYGDKCPSLYIIGEGEYRSFLERKIKDYDLSNNVILTGSVKHSELNSWYSAADLYCLASYREGWPNVLSEALACGLPAVATAIWGVPEIITSPDYGFMVENHDPEILASTLNKALNKDWDNNKIESHGCERTWQVVANEVLDVYDQVLK